MARLLLSAAGLFGALAVALGAFGAHGLRASLSARSLEIFETAARYQLIHAMAMAAVAIAIASIGPSPWFTTAGIAYGIGIGIFCGSLYALSLTDIKILGAIAPIGGSAFIVGWLCLAIAGWVAFPKG